MTSRLLKIARASSLAGLVLALAVPSVRTLRGRLMRVEVAGESMTPALLPGDFLVLRRDVSAYLEAGEVVAVVDPRPEGDGRILLKRVVGLPGEALRIGGGAQVNGRVLDEPYAHGETPAEQHRGINRLGEDEYFLLGDNRGASTDSRDFGPVRREAILGVAWLRYWPPERAGRLRAPARRLLGVADRPGPHAHPVPDMESPPSGSSPLPWLGIRVNPSELPGPPESPPSS